LWLACQGRGVLFEQRSIHSLAELNSFDRVIVAGGALSKRLPELAHFKITPIKGQLLEMAWSDTLPQLACPVASQSYLLMNPNKKTAIIGATYERNFTDLEPDIELTIKEIIPKTQSFFPAVNRNMVIGCRSGVRASTPNHLPILEDLRNGRWLMAGMGSKGLLYHALYAEELSAKI
ncbi:MAG: FAD-dependent oxidoreductase, partial [Parachlamydiaceae bacterium]